MSPSHLTFTAQHENQVEGGSPPRKLKDLSCEIASRAGLAFFQNALRNREREIKGRNLYTVLQNLKQHRLLGSGYCEMCTFFPQFLLVLLTVVLSLIAVYKVRDSTPGATTWLSTSSALSFSQQWLLLNQISKTHLYHARVWRRAIQDQAC